MIFNPATTVLIAMDFQPSIQGSLGDADTVTTKAAAAIAALRDAGGQIAFVRVAFTSDDLAAFPRHSAMGHRMNAVADKVLADASTTQIDARLGQRDDDIVVRKRRVGPFSTTDLNAQLKTAGTETLVLAGIQTSGCVLTAVREAHDLDYRVIVLSDACADPDPALHDVLVDTLFPRQATVISVAAFAAALTHPGAVA